MDTFSKDDRSRIMARVKSSNNSSTEIAFIALLREHHITGWRRRYPLAGKPDFVFPRQRVALFLDGCFWHKCPSHFRMPQSNMEYWTRKIDRNKARDREINRELKSRGWSVLRVWEHEIARKKTARKLRHLKELLGLL